MLPVTRGSRNGGVFSLHIKPAILYPRCIPHCISKNSYKSWPNNLGDRGWSFACVTKSKGGRGVPNSVDLEELPRSFRIKVGRALRWANCFQSGSGSNALLPATSPTSRLGVLYSQPTRLGTKHQTKHHERTSITPPRTPIYTNVIRNHGDM